MGGCCVYNPSHFKSYIFFSLDMNEGLIEDKVAMMRSATGENVNDLRAIKSDYGRVSNNIEDLSNIRLEGPESGNIEPNSLYGRSSDLDSIEFSPEQDEYARGYVYDQEGEDIDVELGIHKLIKDTPFGESLEEAYRRGRMRLENSANMRNSISQLQDENTRLQEENARLLEMVSGMQDEITNKDNIISEQEDRLFELGGRLNDVSRVKKYDMDIDDMIKRLRE